MDINQINQMADFHKILLHYDFSNVTVSESKMRACCKLHNGNKSTSFEVDTDKNLWYCHSSCKTGGNAINLVQQLEGCDFFTACYIVADISGFRVDSIHARRRDVEDAQKIQDWFDCLKPKIISLPIYKPSFYPSQIVQSYRGLNSSTLSSANVSFYPIYPMDEEKKLFNRICFPLTIKGKMVGVSLRSIKKDDMIKWIHLPKGFKKSYFLYNYDECSTYMSENNITEVIVVEGILDCLKFKQSGIFNVVALLGSSISSAQTTLLMRIATTLVISLDGDKVGIESRNKIIKRFHSSFDLFYIDYNENEDPNSLSEEELIERYKNKIKP